MTLLTLRDVSVHRGPCPVVDGAGLRIDAGEFVGLIGPNGAGKTTLMRAALGLLPHRGESSLAALDPETRGRTVAWLPQARELAWPVSTADLVALGRIPWGGRDPDGAVERAIARMGLEAFRHRPVTELSGGEQARVLIARALAQDCPLLMADEPVAGLDPAAQMRAMTVFAELAAEGRAVFASIHDLGLAARYCARLVLIAEGRIVADGPPAEVLTPDRLDRVFGLRAAFVDTDEGRVLVPLGVAR